MHSFRVGRVLIALLLCGPVAAQCDLADWVGSLQDQGVDYGKGVGIAGSTIAVGRPDAGAACAGGSCTTGAVSVYERAPWPASGWVEAQVLLPSVKDHDGDFGLSVALAGDVLLVGAPKDGPAGERGAAYVYERSAAGDFVERARLQPADAGPADHFGATIALSAERLAVASPGHASDGGAVYTYVRGAGGWEFEAKLEAPAVAGVGVGFGRGLAMDVDRLAVGAPYATSAGGFSADGVVYVYERGLGSWVLSDELSVGAGSYQRFGEPLVLEGDTLASLSWSCASACDQRALWVFERENDGSFSQRQAFFGLESSGGDQLALDEGLLLSGHPSSSLAGDGGRVDVYARSPLKFSLVGSYAAPAPQDPFQENEELGRSLALDGGVCVTGSIKSSTLLNGSFGAVHVIGVRASQLSVLTTEESSISLSSGGSQRLQLHACQQLAGQLYLIIGSATGTQPAKWIDGLALGLLPDFYMAASTIGANSAPFTNTLGLLNATGVANASIDVPAGLNAALLGVELHHAGLVFDFPGQGLVQLTTNSVPLRFEL